MLHPNNKFWETTLTGSTVTFRVGKIKDGTESGEERIDKTYPSAPAAKISVVQKITEKLTKGYVGRDAKLKEKI
jgi:predicted DNA-binding WGR domain protein